MVGLYLIFVAAVAGTAGIGALAHRRGWSLAGGPRAWGEAAAARLGPVPGAVVLLVAGYAVTTVVGLGLGFLAKHLEGSVDKPVYHWIYPRVHDNVFTRGQAKLTLIGNNPIIQVVAGIFVIGLVFAYKRRWYVPLLGIAVAVEGEKYVQKFLGKTIDRGHPPLSFPNPGTTKPFPTLGTYPSGGVGRILAVYGAILVLIILLNPQLTRRWCAGLWTGLALAAVVECYSRIYLSKHWLTDAVFGLVFGLLLLLSNAAAITALAWRPEDHDRVGAGADAERAAHTQPA